MTAKRQSVEVIVVVDPNFGKRLASLPPAVPVWVVRTPVNQAAAHELREANLSVQPTRSITTFTAAGSENPEEWCLSILDQVDLHHGSYSQQPPYNQIRFIGAKPSDDLRQALAGLGFTTISLEAHGFLAQGAAA